MGKQLEIEALDTLIRAVQMYQEDLKTNQQILVNAANACDMAMGSDDIAKKHIENLNRALERLRSTSQMAADVAEALIQDKRRAIAVYEEIKGGTI